MKSGIDVEQIQTLNNNMVFNNEAKVMYHSPCIKITGIASVDTIYDLFTKFTFLFTTKSLIPKNIKLDSLKPISKGYETYEKSHLYADFTADCGERTSIC
jgi:hypothetical protein